MSIFKFYSQSNTTKLVIMFSHKNKEVGFTLFELIIVITIASILATIATPSLVGLYRQYQFKDSFRQLVTSVKIAQKQAERLGKTCKIKLEKTAIQGQQRDQIAVVTSSDPGEAGKNYTKCLLNEPIFPSFIELNTNIPGTTNKITFSRKGNTPTSGTIKLSLANSNLAKCLVISDGLGIIRTSKYENNGSKLTAKNCKKESE